MTNDAGRSCDSCAFCGCEPDDDYPNCGHPEAMKRSFAGLYVHRAREAFCTEDLVHWKQHPLRK